MGLTHHANGEVVVDDAVGRLVSGLLAVQGSYVDPPAVQRHLSARLDVPQDLQQALALIAFRSQRERGWERDNRCLCESLSPAEWVY